MSKLFIIKSKTYSDDPREVKDINELRRWMLKWCDPKSQKYAKKKCYEFAVYSSKDNALGALIFSEKYGYPYWYTVKGGLYEVKSNGSLGKMIYKKK